jgi:predicted HTH domain antitoxin
MTDAQLLALLITIERLRDDIAISLRHEYDAAGTDSLAEIAQFTLETARDLTQRQPGKGAVHRRGPGCLE